MAGLTKVKGGGLSPDCEIGGLLKVKDSASMVGIGTMAPAALLHANVTGGSSTAGIFESDQSDAYITFKASGTSANTTVRVGTTGNNFNIFANSSTRLYIKNTGEVGINTTTPLAQLQIKVNDSGDGGLFIINTNGATNSSADLYFAFCLGEGLSVKL